MCVNVAIISIHNESELIQSTIWKKIWRFDLNVATNMLVHIGIFKLRVMATESFKKRNYG